MRESSIIQFRSIAEAELKHQATPEEHRRLHDNPILWLRVLIGLQHDVEGHIGKDHLRLSSMKPMPGEAVSQEYLREKHACDERTVRRMHFLGIVKKRRIEVRALCGDQPVPLVGDVIDVLTKITMLIDDNSISSARKLANTYVEKWSTS